MEKAVTRLAKAPLPAPAWTYWCPEQGDGVEFGALQSDRDAGLKTHFHNETQITFVISGVRSFLVREKQITLIPGQSIVFPAGLPHQALPVETPRTVCLNTYLPAGGYAAAPVVAQLERLWDRRGLLPPDGVLEMLRAYWRQSEAAGSLAKAPVSSTDQAPCLRQRALRAKLSREGFSRRFSQDFGMPPHAYGLISRLNAARRLLRTSVDDLARIAAETGFADQSHMGRLFRRTFGITPGRYRER